MYRSVEYFRNNKPASLVLLIIIGHVSWIKFESPEFLYFFDYVERTVIISICFCIFQFKINDLTNWRQLLSWKNIFIASLAATLILVCSTAIDLTLYFIDDDQIWRWHYFMPIKNPYLKVFDLTIGIALVAIAEELVYRKQFLQVLRDKNTETFGVYFYPAFMFGLLHINQSAFNTILAFFAGLVLMYCYRKSGTLWVPIVIHYVVDVYLFGIGLPFVKIIQN